MIMGVCVKRNAEAPSSEEVSAAVRSLLAYFACGHLDMRGFDKPTLLGAGQDMKESQMVMDYLAKHSLVGRQPMEFKNNLEHGVRSFGYRVVQVDLYRPRSVVYLFLLRAIPGEDEEEFNGYGAYAWRIVGHAREWPTHYSQVTWTAG